MLFAGSGSRNRRRGYLPHRKLLMIALMGIILSISSPQSGFAFAQDEDEEGEEAATKKIVNPVKKAPPKQVYNKENVSEDLIRSAQDVANLPKSIDIGVEIVDFG